MVNEKSLGSRPVFQPENADSGSARDAIGTHQHPGTIAIKAAVYVNTVDLTGRRQDHQDRGEHRPGLPPLLDGLPDERPRLDEPGAAAGRRSSGMRQSHRDDRPRRHGPAR